MYVPTGAVLLTMNEQPEAIVPPETGQVPVAPKPAGLLESITLVSEELKPPPVTATEVPGGPELGLRTSGSTVKVAEAESRVLPVSTTVYVPPAWLPTVIDAESIVPPDMLQDAVEMERVPENEPELQ